MERLTKTGLVIPDRVPWGTYLCQFYETKDDLLEVLVPYFREGLAANESCVWNTFERLTAEEAKNALRAAIPELDHYLTTGQMEIIPHEECCRLDGSLDAVLAAWGKKAEIAFGRGYAGLRATGDVACLRDDYGADFAAHEEKVQSSLHAQKIIALCSYSLTECSTARFIQAINAHDYAIVRRQGGWECIESKGRKQLLDRLLVKKHAIASSISPMVMMDLAGNLTYANPAALKAWGYESEDEVLNRPVVDFWESPQELKAYLEEVRANGEKVVELVAKRKGGSTFDAEIQGSMTLDDRGQPIGMVASCLDVTASKTAEKQLAHFSAIVGSSQDAIYATTPDGVVTSWNPAAERLYGYPAAEMIGKPLSTLVPSERSDEITALLARLRNGERVQQFDTVRCRKDGTLVNVSVTWSSIKNCDAKLIGASVIVHDITASKRTEESLRASEERLSNIIHNAAETVYTLSPDGVFTFVSPGRGHKELGHNISEVEGRDFASLIHPDDVPKCQATLKTAAISGEPQRDSYRVRHNDGSWRWHRSVVSFIRESQGRPAYFVGVAEDITERMLAEEKLRSSEEKYRTYIDNSPTGVFVIDLRGRFVEVNAAGCRLLGYSKEELTQLGIPDVVAPEHVQAAMATFYDGFQTGSVVTSEFCGIRKDGSRFFLWVHGVKIQAERVIGFCEDITQRVNAEQTLKRSSLALEQANQRLEQAHAQAQSANRTKSEFLANMSHEIRSPMTAILGFADILLENSASAETIESAQIIKRNGEHLLTLINDILDLSKIEAGKFTIDPQKCSPNQIASEAISLMKVRADAKGLPLTLEVHGDVPERITTDPIRLRQILINLIGNSLKFTEVGSVRIVMRRATTPNGDAKLAFDVIDTGIGMSEEQMSLLFQPFSQVDGSASRRFSGTGLGLAISKRLAEMLAGDIVVSSSPGQGATFSLSIGTDHLDGLAVDRESSIAATIRETVCKPQTTLACRVLLAEDGPDNQRLIGFLLRKAGAKVELAENGRIALDLALAARQAGSPFDIILMDMQMPVMDGYEATQKLRSAGYTEPIIALTAHAMTGDRQKCMDAGCNDYITKPIDPKKFAGRLEPWLAREPSPV